ncbi:hypothetical protein M0657_009838 [Pyricularia oryzae]|nr:hypothetical protein M0657_009838 [Pyricularia oryzae]
MAHAQPLISLVEEKVGCPGFGYTTGGEPLSDLCEATVENNYGVSNCTTPNATATAFSSERHSKNSEIFICKLCQGGKVYQGKRRDNFASHVERHTRNDDPNTKVKYHPNAENYLQSIKNSQFIETFRGEDLS